MNSDALSLIYRYKKSPVIDRIRIGGDDGCSGLLGFGSTEKIKNLFILLNLDNLINNMRCL